jgi:hypothetical protein
VLLSPPAPALLPSIQGRITCCNVTSDLYAMGVTEIDTMLMLLAVRANACLASCLAGASL